MKNLLLFLCLWSSISQAQSVGIGTLNPHSSAILDVTSDSLGMLVPRLRTTSRLAIPNPEEGLLVFDMNTLSFWVWRGIPDGGWTELSTPNNGLWQKNGSKIYNTNTGYVGIGTNNPQAPLQIDKSFGNAGLLFSENGVASGSIGFEQFVNASNMHIQNLKEDGRIKLSTQASQLMLNKTYNSVSIGPTGWSGPTLLIADMDNDPIIQFQKIIQGDPNSNFKGFVQIAGDNIRIGTNNENPDGKFIVRTNNADRVAVDKNGNMGIGTLSPATKLDIIGDINVTGEMRNTSKTGSANLLPICYGNVKSDGTINTGSNNFTVNRTGVGTYVITITGYAYHYLTYLSTVTPSFLNSPQLAVTTSFSGDLIVRIFNLAGNLVDGYFNFVVHRP